MPSAPVPTQEEAAYFDYVEGVKQRNYAVHVRGVLDRYRQRVQAITASGGSTPSTRTEAGPFIESDTGYRFAAGVQRASQQMAWAAARRSVDRERANLLRSLDEVIAREPIGNLELVEGFPIPDWYTAAAEAGTDDIHLKPYWRDDLEGAIYDRGGAIYRLGWRKVGRVPASDMLLTWARSGPAEPRRILDFGCAFGSSTMALRLAHPDAEVTGIDFAENTLRWAHARAEENGVAIEYAQRDATNTGFEDASFDLVTAFLFFHEIPPEVQDAAMREAHRLLEPGGQIIILDMPPYAALDPGVAYVESFDQRGNGENFWDGFLSRDRGAALEAAGFEDVMQGLLEWEDLGDWGAAALMRTGEFHPDQQWSARGTRPAS